MPKRWSRRGKRVIKTALREQQWLLPLSGVIVGALLALMVADVGRQPDPGHWAVTVDRARDTMMSILAILFAGLAIMLSLATITAQTHPKWLQLSRWTSRLPTLRWRRR